MCAKDRSQAKVKPEQGSPLEPVARSKRKIFLNCACRCGSTVTKRKIPQNAGGGAPESARGGARAERSGDMRLSEKTDIASGILMAAEIVPEMVAKMLASYLSGRILSEMLITAWDAAALTKTQRAEGSLQESAL